MNNKILLSVIVPVYNVEKYIEECVESIWRDGKYFNIQIILVDDGSTDGSAKKCDELAKKANIEVWHKKNGGLASARNFGFKKANGKFIAFVDGDDKIDSDSLEKILNYLDKNESDVTFMNLTKFYPDGRLEDMGENIEKAHLKGSKRDIIKYLSTRQKFPASACGKIYKRDFLVENQLSFPDDGRISEDLDFALECIGLAESYDKIEGSYYLYRQERENSITNSVSTKSFFGVSMFVSKYATDHKFATKNDYNRYLLGFVAYEYAILLWLYGYVEKSMKKTAKRILKDCRPVLKYSNTNRLKIIKLFVTIFGISITSKILQRIKK